MVEGRDVLGRALRAACTARLMIWAKQLEVKLDRKIKKDSHVPGALVDSVKTEDTVLLLQYVSKASDCAVTIRGVVKCKVPDLEANFR
jgi:hypothetical protein